MWFGRHKSGNLVSFSFLCLWTLLNQALSEEDHRCGDLLMKEVPGNVHIPIIIIFVYVSIVKKKIWIIVVFLSFLLL